MITIESHVTTIWVQFMEKSLPSIYIAVEVRNSVQLCSVREREADAGQNPYTSQSTYPSVDQATARHLSCFFWNYHLEESSD